MRPRRVADVLGVYIARRGLGVGLGGRGCAAGGLGAMVGRGVAVYLVDVAVLGELAALTERLGG